MQFAFLKQRRVHFSKSMQSMSGLSENFSMMSRIMVIRLNQYTSIHITENRKKRREGCVCRWKKGRQMFQYCHVSSCDITHIVIKRKEKRKTTSARRPSNIFISSLKFQRIVYLLRVPFPLGSYSACILQTIRKYTVCTCIRYVIHGTEYKVFQFTGGRQMPPKQFKTGSR